LTERQFEQIGGIQARKFRAAECRHLRRTAFIYVPNGVNNAHWWPTGGGSTFSLGSSLSALEAYKSDLQVIAGLGHKNANGNGDGPGDHARAAAVFLTGVQPLKQDGRVRLGPSADQVAAQAIGERTRFRSLELGVDPSGNSGQCDSGYACAYSSNVSWQSETTPADKEINPRLVFDRLFRGGADGEDAAARAERLRRRRSVLDFVQEDAQRLRARLSNADRAKLEEYFGGVRELERRIEQAEGEMVLEVGDELRPAGVPRDYGEHLRLLMDLLVLALKTDSTRIATLMFANEGSDRAYRQIEVSEGHHSLSHHGKDARKQEQIRRINRFHVEQLAYFLQRLEAETEQGRSLLADCMIVYGSCIGDGDRHNHDELPVLLCGGGGGLRPGRHLELPPTPMMNLHLALLERLGVPAAALGDSTGVLEGI
jgi:hypothetical protein